MIAPIVTANDSTYASRRSLDRPRRIVCLPAASQHLGPNHRRNGTNRQQDNQQHSQSRRCPHCPKAHRNHRRHDQQAADRELPRSRLARRRSGNHNRRRHDVPRLPPAKPASAVRRPNLRPALGTLGKQCGYRFHAEHCSAPSTPSRKPFPIRLHQPSAARYDCDPLALSIAPEVPMKSFSTAWPHWP